MNSPTLTNIQVTPELGGLLAVPQGAGPWPAVVMVHEVFGIDDNMKAQAKPCRCQGCLAANRKVLHGTPRFLELIHISVLGS
jgi:dienelactone hydrolase